MLTNRIRNTVLSMLLFVLAAVPHTIVQAGDSGQGANIPRTTTETSSSAGQGGNIPRSGASSTETAEEGGLFSVVDYIQILVRLIP